MSPDAILALISEHGVWGAIAAFLGITALQGRAQSRRPPESDPVSDELREIKELLIRIDARLE